MNYDLKMEIPFHKPYVTEEEITEVVDSLKSGWWTMGPKTVRFEEQFGRYRPLHTVAQTSFLQEFNLPGR